MENRRDSDHWQLKKEVSLGDLIAIIVAILAVLSAYARLDVRVTEVEVTNRVQTKVLQDALTELKIEIRRMADGFDRFKEQQNGKK